ncbi:MetQ/NlpA family ABC transporter substrate-binding protein [Peribacillus asahii]|uniref:NLPA lipoprotein n=1 Tax=Peribacillus asahii TaxID=228899 RepID=A0A3Q9RN39_9BACI|nr:MetQ/NlpA family ABC transporter substrate-binding protein [Peribacillus asahii]AZV42902.1 NLPA lipoprotein [Peribacillus asahii]USK87112.1 MetQ/NlpA family ABC transporter substrate-binding protein [Peribacillus asahii]
MKKFALFVVSILTVVLLAACGSSDVSKSASTDDTKHIRIGFSPGPYSDQVRKGIQPILKEKGYTIEFVEFTSGNEINFALAEGSLDANIFQHTAYFESFIKENKLDLVETIKVPTAPMGIYSDKLTEIKLDTSTKYKVLIPNDPPNIARALRILEEGGFLTLKSDYDPLTVSLHDIESYKVEIEFVEVEQAQLARLISDVDYAVVNGNYVLASDRKLSDSLLLENPPFEYQNLIAVRTEDKDKTFVKDLTDAYQTEDFQQLIETDPQFEGFWQPPYFK